MVKQSFDPGVTAALPVLLTRPLPQGQAFAQRLGKRFGAGLYPVICPLMAPRFLDVTVPEGGFASVIFTSTTGVAAAARLTHLPRRALCVGRQTAHVARAAGFEATSTDGDAEALVTAILADPPGGRLLHLRGQESQGNLAQRLTAAGVPTVGLVVYWQEPQSLDAGALALLRTPGPVIVPVFSPRSAQLLHRALPSDMRATLFLAALSPAVAEAASQIPHRALITARRPDADAMLDAIAELIPQTLPP